MSVLCDRAEDARGCVKTPTLNLRVESGSRFRQSEANNSNKYCREKAIEKMILCIRGLCTFSHRLAPLPSFGAVQALCSVARTGERETTRTRSHRHRIASLRALTGSRKEIGDAPTVNTGHPVHSAGWRSADTKALAFHVQSMLT